NTAAWMKTAGPLTCLGTGEPNHNDPSTWPVIPEAADDDASPGDSTPETTRAFAGCAGCFGSYVAAGARTFGWTGDQSQQVVWAVFPARSFGFARMPKGD